MARFLSLGVVQGDLVRFKGHDWVASVLQAESEETLTLDETPADLPKDQRAEIEVLRPVEAPCPVCKEDGQVAEADHRHCVRCKGRRPLAKNRAEVKLLHCDDCVTSARKKLVAEREFVDQAVLFGGRRTITLHARTVSECDSMQEWQDWLILNNPKMSTQYMLDESAKAALAIALDDDGAGGNALALIKPETPDEPTVRIPIMMKHFKGMNDAAFKAMLKALSRLDALVEQACIYKIEDKFGDEAKMELAEKLATSFEEVTGTVEIFEGETLTFAATVTDAMDEADAFAESFLQGSRDKMLEGRGRFIQGLARMAAVFRGDGKQQFSASSSFEERMGYLLTLPLPLYYLYVMAAGVWQRRVIAASDVTTLGNS